MRPKSGFSQISQNVPDQINFFMGRSKVTVLMHVYCNFEVFATILEVSKAMVKFSPSAASMRNMFLATVTSVLVQS